MLSLSGGPTDVPLDIPFPDPTYERDNVEGDDARFVTGYHPFSDVSHHDTFPSFPYEHLLLAKKQLRFDRKDTSSTHVVSSNGVIKVARWEDGNGHVVHFEGVGKPGSGISAKIELQGFGTASTSTE